MQTSFCPLLSAPTQRAATAISKCLRGVRRAHDGSMTTQERVLRMWEGTAPSSQCAPTGSRGFDTRACAHVPDRQIHPHPRRSSAYEASNNNAVSKIRRACVRKEKRAAEAHRGGIRQCCLRPAGILIVQACHGGGAVPPPLLLCPSSPSSSSSSASVGTPLQMREHRHGYSQPSKRISRHRIWSSPAGGVHVG